MARLAKHWLERLGVWSPRTRLLPETRLKAVARQVEDTWFVL